MPRDTRAYLVDIVESCDAVASAIGDLDFEAYSASRLIRSSVEREFIIIGEAANALSRGAPDVFARIGAARRIVDFRNRLTHEYSSVNDAVVWAIARRESVQLRGECQQLLDELGSAD